MSKEEIVELNKKLSRLKKGSNSFIEIKTQLEGLVLSKLNETDPNIEKILSENQQLLSNKDILFKVYREGGSYFGTHATRLKGKNAQEWLCLC